MSKIAKIALAGALIFLTIQPVQAQEDQKVGLLDINLHYNLGQVTLDSIEKRSGYLPSYLNQPDSGYKLEVYDSNDEVLWRIIFNFELGIATRKGPTEEVTETNKLITIAANPNAQRFVLYDPQGQQILEHQLASLVSPELEQTSATSTEQPKTGLRAISIIGAVVIGLVVIGLAIFWFLKRRSSE